MKKVPYKVLYMIIAGTLTFTGCTSEDMEQGAELITLDAVVKQESESVEEETAEDDESIASIETDEIGVEENSNSLQDSNDEVDYVEEIQGNNGYFVQWGDKVFFHAPSEKDMSQAVIWANYAFADSGSTILYSVGVDDDEVILESRDHAWGKMSKNGDYLVFEAELDSDAKDRTGLRFFSPAGASYANENTEGQRYVAGDRDGHYTISYFPDKENVDRNVYYLQIYKDGVAMEPVKAEGNPWFGICGITGEDFIFICWKSGEDEAFDKGYYLMDLNLEDHTITNLGMLPSIHDGVCQVDQFEVQGDKIYLSIGHYAGSGLFFQKGWFVSAQIGREDSVQYEDQTRIEAEEEPYVSSPFMVVEGEMVPCYGIPGTADIREDEIGYYNDLGEWTSVASGGFESYTDEDGDKGLYNDVIELVGNDIYVIANEVEHVEEEDIGWRYAYRRLKTYVYRVDLKTGEKTVLLEITPEE